MSIDLSTASDDGMALILLRVPVKDLIKICPQVSPQWDRILSDNFFWRMKMEQDGYKLEWPKLAGLSTKSFKTMALKHCFGRNLIKDCWDLDPNIDQNLTLDPRWETDRIWQWEEEHLVDDSFKAMIEIPPAFIEGDQDIQPKFDTSIEACISIDTETFGKDIIIKLADEGLTDDIMDNFRPTIVISEMVGKRLDGDIIYTMRCSLDASIDDEDDHFPKHPIPNEDQYGVFRNESRDENGRWVDVTIDLQLGRYQGEGWHRVEHVFKDYPIGMRYLTLNCKGVDFYGSPYGLKLANCSVMALCEKNAEMKGI